MKQWQFPFLVRFRRLSPRKMKVPFEKAKKKQLLCYVYVVELFCNIDFFLVTEGKRRKRKNFVHSILFFENVLCLFFDRTEKGFALSPIPRNSFFFFFFVNQFSVIRWDTQWSFFFYQIFSSILSIANLIKFIFGTWPYALSSKKTKF